MRLSDEDPDRRFRTRLDLLLALMVVQLVLLIGLWIDRSRSEPAEMVELPVVSEMSEEEPLQTHQTTEPTSPQSVDASRTRPPAEAEVAEPVRLQVLNGCGVTGIAGRTRDWLVRNGYDVRDVGNAARQDYRQSQIINRSGNLTAARELADLLGIDRSLISSRSDAPSLQVDLTLIIGRDYKRLRVAR